MTRDAFKAGRIRLLVNEYDGETYLAKLKGYDKLDAREKLMLQMPYIDTTLLINELINLKNANENDPNSKSIKLVRYGTGRKDRYSSLSYGYWVACQLEIKLRRKRNSGASNEDEFMFRAPKIK